jgi:hypothetical protein
MRVCNFQYSMTPASLNYLYKGLFYSRDWTMEVVSYMIPFDEFVRSDNHGWCQQHAIDHTLAGKRSDITKDPAREV